MPYNKNTIIENKNITKIYACIFSLIIHLFVSCGSVLMPPLEVREIRYDSEKISIFLSADVDEASFQRAFSLTEDNSSVSGVFKYGDKSAYFYPVDGIKANYDYAVKISVNAEDKRGYSLMTEYNTSFSTRREKEAPRIISISPENESSVTTTTFNYIELIFSESINQKSFVDSFSVSPAFDYFVEFLADDTVIRITPKKELAVNTDYTIKVSDKVEDRCRNKLREETTYLFTYDTSPALPTYTVSFEDDSGVIHALSEETLTAGLGTKGKLKISFSNAMVLSSISSYLSITPSLQYVIKKDEIHDQYVVLELKEIEWGKTHTLHFANGLADIYGNKLAENKAFSFVCNKRSFMPPSFIEGYVQLNDWSGKTVLTAGDFLVINKDSNYSYLVLDSSYYQTSVTKACLLYLVFETSIDSNGIDIYSLMNHFSIPVTNTCMSIVIKTMKIMSDSEITSSHINEMKTTAVTDTSNKISIVEVGLEISNTSRQGTVAFSFDTGIADTLGNKFLKNNIFVFNK